MNYSSGSFYGFHKPFWQNRGVDMTFPPISIKSFNGGLFPMFLSSFYGLELTCFNYSNPFFAAVDKFFR